MGASLFIEMDGQVRAYETNAIDSDEPPAGIQGIGSDPVPDVANEGEDEGVGIEMEWDDQAVRGGRGGGEQDQVPSESRAVLASMENWDSVPAVDIQGESDGLEMDDDSEAENNPPLESPVGIMPKGTTRRCSLARIKFLRLDCKNFQKTTSHRRSWMTVASQILMSYQASAMR